MMTDLLTERTISYKGTERRTHDFGMSPKNMRVPHRHAIKVYLRLGGFLLRFLIVMTNMNLIIYRPGEQCCLHIQKYNSFMAVCV